MMESTAKYENIKFSKESLLITPVWFHELKPGDRFDFGYHEHLEIKYFLSGGAAIDREGHSFIAEEGDIFVINPRERHATRWIYGNPCYHCIMVDSTLLRSAEHTFIDTVYLQPYTEGRLFFNNCIRGNREVCRDLESLIEELRSESPGYELMVQGLLFILFARLFRTEVREIMDARRFGRLRRLQEQIAPIHDYVSLHYHESLRLTALAELCHLSEHHFCSIFREATGTTPMTYINRCRVEKAQILLQTTNIPIASIAEQCGFADMCYFSRCYRKHKGYAPSAERKQSGVCDYKRKDD